MQTLDYLNPDCKQKFISSKYTKFSSSIKSRPMAYEHIKRMLSDAGENQADLARLLGRTPAVITNLFNGERSLQIEEVQKISARYGVSTDYVLYGKEFDRPKLYQADDALLLRCGDSILAAAKQLGLKLSLAEAMAYTVQLYKHAIKHKVDASEERAALVLESKRA